MARGKVFALQALPACDEPFVILIGIIWRVRRGPYGPLLPQEPGVQVSPHRTQALRRRPEAPGDRCRGTFTIRVCTGLTQSAHRVFNGTKDNHRLSSHSGLAFPYPSRDPRPVGSRPPFGVGQSSNPFPAD